MKASPHTIVNNNNIFETESNMTKKNWYIVANWKMYRPLKRNLDWLVQYQRDLDLMASVHNIIICPSYADIYALKKKSGVKNILWGAQNCAAHESGAYTGEVSAQTLKQIGCNYSLVGHSERRTLFGETSKTVAQKTDLLIANQITPIICIGESKAEKDTNKTAQALKEQLSPVIDILQNKTTQVCIAYEPTWAIGTGQTPTPQHIVQSLTIIKNEMNAAPNTTYNLLYGGSVTSSTTTQLKEIHDLNGLLIGKSSLDFQELKKIVSYLM